MKNLGFYADTYCYSSSNLQVQKEKGERKKELLLN